MDFFDWTNMQFYHYLVIGGGVLALLALIGYFVLKTPKVQIPAIVVGVVASLALGIGLGVVLMAAYGDQITDKEKEAAEAPRAGGGRGPGMNPGGGMMGGGRGGGGMMGGGRGGGGMMGGGMMGGGPSSKTQLANLVGKLDQLTSKALTLSLTEEQKKVIAEQTKDLLDKKELEEKDAKTRLDALLKTLEKDKATFEAAGYRWPAQGGGQRGGGQRGMMQPPRQEPKNPFKEEKNEKHLKAIREQVGPGKPMT
jgi:hypothetical protein